MNSALNKTQPGHGKVNALYPRMGKTYRESQVVTLRDLAQHTFNMNKLNR